MEVSKGWWEGERMREALKMLKDYIETGVGFPPHICVCYEKAAEREKITQVFLRSEERRVG